MSKIQGAHIPLKARNLAINGNFDFWQEREGQNGVINGNFTFRGYACDQFAVASQGPTNKVYTFQRSSLVPTLAQSGTKSTYSSQFTLGTTIPSFAAADFVEPLQYAMEGLDYQKLHGGKKLTIGFWIMALVPGVYSLSLRNSAGTRNYTTSFTIAGASTWQFVSIPVTTDVGNEASWAFDNTLGLIVGIGTIGGTNFQAGTINTWGGGNAVVAPGAVNWFATASATINISQFSIVEGGLGFNATGFQRAADNIEAELAMCQRYYAKTYDQGLYPGQPGTNPPLASSYAFAAQAQSASVHWQFPVSMRGVASVTIYNHSGGSTGNWGDSGGGAISMQTQSSTTAGTFAVNTGVLAQGRYVFGHMIADARL